MATTGLDHHTSLFLQDDIGTVIKGQDRDIVKLGTGHSRAWEHFWVAEVDSGLHDGGPELFIWELRKRCSPLRSTQLSLQA